VSEDAVIIHPTALVDGEARLGTGVEIGPFAVVEGNVELGDNVKLGPHVHVASGSHLAEGVQVFTGAAVGNIPQDLKFAGEESTLEVGPRTIIREFCTLHRGTIDSGTTQIGADCLLMAYVHIAHDCVVRDHCVLANSLQMGGHVILGEWVVIGGGCAIHQFCHIGDHAMVGGGFRVVQDIPPYIRAAGEPLKPAGVNSIGLQRRGFDSETISLIKKAYRFLFRSGLNRSNAIEKIQKELPQTTEILNLLTFIQKSERGLIG
jgi:UDP-N-acetylglucosamine acyltransferase